MSSTVEPGDYVIATGEQHSVREFVERAFAEVGIGLAFEGEGLEEVGVVSEIDAGLLERARNGCGVAAGGAEGPIARGRALMRVDHRYYRPTEVTSLLGNTTKARQRLGWEPTSTLAELISEMVRGGFNEARREELDRSGRGKRVTCHRTQTRLNHRKAGCS